MVFKYITSFFKKKEESAKPMNNVAGDYDDVKEDDFSDYGIVSNNTETEKAVMEERRRKHHEHHEHKEPEVIVIEDVTVIVIEENYGGTPC